ncbi:MAG: response regulator transcription factor [Ferruginibacter sp.]|nr:response regulator transcription factor [Ferruginibacter sp.]
MKNFLLIDDHEIVRSGVKNVLQELFKPCDIYEASDEKSALSQLKLRKYDLVIMDVQMPGTDTAGLMEYIKTRYADIRVLMFSMSSENVYAKRFLKAGAMGFVSKNSGLTELKKAVELVLNDRKYISEALAEQLAAEIGSQQPNNPFDKLSAREFEVANLLMTGKSGSDISELLSINSSTVGTHKARLFEKLGVTNLPELIEIARIYKLNFA